MSKRKIDRRTFLKIAGVTTGVAVGGGIAAHVGLDDSLLLGLWRYLFPMFHIHVPIHHHCSFYSTPLDRVED